jgi:hypothetical protein
MSRTLPCYHSAPASEQDLRSKESLPFSIEALLSGGVRMFSSNWENPRTRLSRSFDCATVSGEE